MTRRAHYRTQGRPPLNEPAPCATLVKPAFQKQNSEHWIRLVHTSYEQILGRRRIVGFTPNSIFA